MHRFGLLTPRRLLLALTAVLAVLPLALQLGATDAAHFDHNAYDRTNLVSDQAGVARRTDANLVNAWGIVAGPHTPFWVADNHSGVSTAYLGNGLSVPPVVTIPPPTGSPPDTLASPTGVVYNNSGDFKLNSFQPATYIFATEDGTISGWNPAVSFNHATLKVDNSGAGAVYKGLALASANGNSYIYATNFNAGTVDVFNKSFAPVTLAGHFTDPNLPTGYAPFNIANVNGRLYVTFALQDADKHDDQSGPGNGFVDIFDTQGHLQRRLISGGHLNSPWGLVMAPDDFGKFSDALLVGNFGDGWLNAYDAHTGQFLGSMQDRTGTTIVIPGLWGLTFGNGNLAGQHDTLFFTAGPGGEEHGLFGSITTADGSNHGGGGGGY